MSVIYPAWKEYNGTEHPAQVLFEGAVLADRERNGYHDSDFYVIAWDGAKLVSHEYATTRFGGGGHASVDVTPEVLEKVRRYLLRSFMRQWLADNEQRATLEPSASSRPTRVSAGAQRDGENLAPLPYQNNGRFGANRNLAARDYSYTPPGFRKHPGAHNVMVIDPKAYQQPVKEGAQLVRGAVRNVVQAAVSFCYGPARPGWQLVA